MLGWGCRCAPSCPRGRHAAMRQERLRPGCAPWHGDAAIVWRASGAWWGVQPDLWYCCETGMLLVVLGWQKPLGVASCGMGSIPGPPHGVSPLAGLPHSRCSPVLAGTRAGWPRWLLACSASHRSTWESCDQGVVNVSRSDCR